jgi:hypothetical protein
MTVLVWFCAEPLSRIFSRHSSQNFRGSSPCSTCLSRGCVTPIFWSPIPSDHASFAHSRDPDPSDSRRVRQPPLAHQHHARAHHASPLQHPRPAPVLSLSKGLLDRVYHTRVRIPNRCVPSPIGSTSARLVIRSVTAVRCVQIPSDPSTSRCCSVGCLGR